MLDTTDIFIALGAAAFGALAVLVLGRRQPAATNPVHHHKPKRSTSEHEQVMTIVNNLADAVFSTDADGIVKVYNAAALNLLDTNHSLVGSSISEVMPLRGSDGATVDLFATVKKANRVTMRDDLLTGSSDDPLRLELTFAPIRSDYDESE